MLVKRHGTPHLQADLTQEWGLHRVRGSGDCVNMSLEQSGSQQTRDGAEMGLSMMESVLQILRRVHVRVYAWYIAFTKFT